MNQGALSSPRRPWLLLEASRKPVKQARGTPEPGGPPGLPSPGLHLRAGWAPAPACMAGRVLDRGASARPAVRHCWVPQGLKGPALESHCLGSRLCSPLSECASSCISSPLPPRVLLCEVGRRLSGYTSALGIGSVSHPKFPGAGALLGVGWPAWASKSQTWKP